MVLFLKLCTKAYCLREHKTESLSEFIDKAHNI